MADKECSSSRLPRLKLSLHGQKRSYSLTNLACKKWFSEESLPSKLLKRSFQKSKIPEPCEFIPLPVYRSLRPINNNYRSSESLYKNEMEQCTNTNPNNCPKLTAETADQQQTTFASESLDGYVADQIIRKEQQFAKMKSVSLEKVRPPWKPAGLLTERKNPASITGPVERIRNCCRLMKQNAPEKEPKRKAPIAPPSVVNPIDLLKKNIEAQQEEILLLQEMLAFPPVNQQACEVKNNIEDDPTQQLRDCTNNKPSMDFVQPKVKGENMSLGYHSLNSEYGNKRELEIVKENDLLRVELQETKDHSELLEFRILEFTEGIQRVAVNSNSTCDQGTCTSTDSFFIPAVPNPFTDEDLFLSMCSEFETSVETNPKHRLKDYQNLLNQLDESVKPDKRPMIGHLNDLLEWASVIPEVHLKNLAPINGADWHGNVNNTDMNEDNLCSSLTLIAARLQETLADPKSQEFVIFETIAKLREFDTSISHLHNRVSLLTSENKGLQEALATLHESQETRTEASGTESELVNAKTVQSDLSDAESDESPQPIKTYNMNYDNSNASTQTIQKQNDVYSINELKENVIHSKDEHAMTMEAQKRWMIDMEQLKLEKKNLVDRCTNLESQLRIANSDSCRDAAEVLRTEMRILQDRLNSSDRLKRQFFDEKCEIEEAENDSRLMAQRLESQLDAAREMESLLSASLSQEQEFSRELQRRVRDLQSIEKGRRIHEEDLEIENDSLRFREAELSDNLENQTFALYCLMFGDLWRRFATLNTKAVVPYVDMFCEPSCDDSLWKYCSNTWSTYTESSIEKEIVNVVQLNDVAIQTVPEIISPPSKQLINLPTKTNEIIFSGTGVYYSPHNDSELDDDLHLSTKLQAEIQSLQLTLDRSNSSLEEVTNDKCQLLLKLKEYEVVLSEIKAECVRHVKGLNVELTTTTDQYKKERDDMIKTYTDHVEELRKNSEIHEQRFSALLQHYSILQQELAGFLDNNGSHNNGNTKMTTTKDLLSAVRELAKSELEAKHKVRELEKKESAYRETISEADLIMSSHVTAYTTRIEELEGELELKSIRLCQLEKSEETFRCSSNEGIKIMELHERLIEAENSELQLKQRVLNLERSGKQLDIKFAEAEQVQENLKSKLQDQEELVRRFESLTSENHSLSLQIQKAHEASMRASDIRLNEVFFKNRIEELETAEIGLNAALKESEQIIYQRDRKFRDQVISLEEEISNLRNHLEIKATEASQMKKIELNLKKQVEELKEQIMSLENDLRESSAKHISNESQHRSEVTRLRLQLKVVNNQLLEIDSINGEFRCRLNETEVELKEVSGRLEEHTHCHESEIMALSRQLAQKTSKLEDFEAEFSQLTYSNLLEEFHYLKSSLLQLQNCLRNFLEDSNNCEECARSKNLKNLSKSLNYLVKLINNRANVVESEDEDIDQKHRKIMQDLKQCYGSIKEISLLSPITLTHSDHLVPSVPPRPRRDAKVKKRKVRNILQKEGSILQELEETTLELGLVHDYRLPTIKALEDLEENVRHCQAVITQKDEHLQLADLETNELHSRLIAEKSKMANKIDEVNQANKAVTSLRQELKNTEQKYETMLETLEDKYKIDLRALNQKMELLVENVQKTSKSSRGKDKIIQAFTDILRSTLKSEVLSNIANEMKTFGTNSSDVAHFDVDNVYQQLNASFDERCSFDQSGEFNILGDQSDQNWELSPDLISRTPFDSPMSLHNSSNCSHITSNGSTNPNANSNNMISKIPRFKNSPIQYEECILNESGNQVFSRSIHRLYTESAKYINKHGVKPGCSCERDDQDGRSEYRAEVKCVTDKYSFQTPPIAPARRILRSSSVGSIDKKFQSMLLTSGSSNVFSVVKPRNLRITRRVGNDGALIAWTPVDQDNIAGFQVIVGGLVVQVIRSPHRTKALVNGLSFSAPFTIALVTVTKDGRCSTPALIHHAPDRHREQKLRRSVSMPLTSIRNTNVPAYL